MDKEMYNMSSGDELATANVDPPYWLVNVPRGQWTTKCPHFLIHTSTRDQKILSTPEGHSHRLTWKEVQQIVGRVVERSI